MPADEHSEPPNRTDRLLQLCRHAQAGAVPPQALGGLVQATLADMENARGDFSAQVARLSPAMQSAMQAEIAAVLSAYDAYRGGLAFLERFAMLAGIQDLQAGMDQLEQATQALLVGLTDFEARDLLLAGPSQNPQVNLLARMARQRMAGELGEDSYRSALEISQAAALSLCREVEAGDLSVRDELPALEESVRAYRAALELFKTADDPGRLSQAALQLEEAISRLSDVGSRMAYRRLSSGPSKSPDFNLLGSAMRGFAEGMLPVEAYRQAIEDFRAGLMEADKQIGKVRAAARGSSTVLGLIEQVAGASGTLKDFARELEACPTRQAAASLLADYDSLVPAVDAMVETFQSVLERLDQATRILCLRCQHHNPPLSRSCENCHAQLPRMDGFVSQSSFAVLEGGAEMPITEELHELFTAVNQVVEQKIDFEEFLVVVEAMKQFVNDQEQQVRARAQKELDRRRKCRVSDAPENEVLSFLEHGLDVITQGFDMIWTGLELMAGYPEQPNPATLMEAVRRTHQGFQHLYDLQQRIEAAEDVGDRIG